MPQQRERVRPEPQAAATGAPNSSAAISPTSSASTGSTEPSGLTASAGDLSQARACDGALSDAFNLLGKRWNGMILNALSPGPAGYSELRRALGTITDSVLSDRLTELAAAGLLTRSVTDTRPPGVSYALTGAGAALLPVLEQLAQWASANLGVPRLEEC